MVVRDIDTGVHRVFTDNPGLGYFSDVGLLVGHNIIEYDLPAIRDIWGIDFLDLFRSGSIGIQDTLVASRLMFQDIDGGHSLGAWGKRLGVSKGEFNDWSALSQSMIDYCVQDTAVNLKLYQYLMKKMGSWTDAIELENYVAYLCRRMHDYGFPFDAKRAERLRDVLTRQRDALDAKIADAFPPKVVPIGEFTPRQTKAGTLSVVGLRWYNGPLEHFSVDSPFTRITIEPFKATSPKQVCERLWDAGWKPTEKTDGHKDNRDKTKAEHYAKYGWKISEINLGSVPDYNQEEEWVANCRIQIEENEQSITETTTRKIENSKRNGLDESTTAIQKRRLTDKDEESTALVQKTLLGFYQNKEAVAEFVDKTKHLWWITVTPQGKFVDCSATFATDISHGLKDTQSLQETISRRKAAGLLLRRMILETRIRKLTEWLDAYRPDTGCVHGRFNHIGSWTHRMSHNSPNMANIAAKKSIKYNSRELNKLAKYLGGMFRRLWRAPKGKMLIGVDAAGIQLRVLAHYMNDKDFIHAVTKGSQSTGDDPHTLNKKALGAICETRDRAKTFIYAFLMGCTAGKVREIFGCSQAEATKAFDNFIKFYPGLYKLRTEIIPGFHSQGFFKGLDGRLIITPAQERLIMAGMLQGGEAVIVKRAVVQACKELDKLGIKYNLINIVHDEVIFMIDDDKELGYTVKSIVEKAIAAQGDSLKLNCPMEGDGKMGYNWLTIH